MQISPGHICAGQERHQLIFDYLILNVEWYCSVCALSDVFMVYAQSFQTEIAVHILEYEEVPDFPWVKMHVYYYYCGSVFKATFPALFMSKVYLFVQPDVNDQD